MNAQAAIDLELVTDTELARLVAKRDVYAIRLVTTRNNQRLFRAAWSILKDHADAEDAVQSAYLHAFAAIDTFEGRSSLSTWLTRIVINEALGRRRAADRKRAQLENASVTILDDYREQLMRGSTSGASPDAEYLRVQLKELLEGAVQQLPDEFRPVFVLREIEGMTVEETADVLGIIPATVKTRLHRAKGKLRQILAPEVRMALDGTFPFAGADCARLTEQIVATYCRPQDEAEGLPTPS